MNKEYVPFYSAHTGIPLGSYPTAEDVLARSVMIKEAGLRCTGETWLPGSGNVPIYSGPELDKNLLLTLCLQELIDEDEVKLLNNLAEYRKQFERANGASPYIVRDGNHHLEIDGVRFAMDRLPEFIEKLKAKPDFAGQKGK